MNAKSGTKLEHALRFEPDDRQFAQQLKDASLDEARNTLRSLAAAGDLDTGNPVADLARRVGELYQRVTRELPQDAHLELNAAQSRPDIFAQMLAHVPEDKMPEVFAEAQSIAKDIHSEHALANLALLKIAPPQEDKLFDAMLCAIKKGKLEQLESLILRAKEEFPAEDLLNRSRDGENDLLKKILEVTSARERRQSGFLMATKPTGKLDVETSADFIRLLMKEGAVPTDPLRSGVVYDMEKKHFPGILIDQTAAKLMEYLGEKRLPRHRIHYDDDHPQVARRSSPQRNAEERRNWTQVMDKEYQPEIKSVSAPDRFEHTQGTRGHHRGMKSPDTGGRDF